MLAAVADHLSLQTIHTPMPYSALLQTKSFILCRAAVIASGLWIAALTLPFPSLAAGDTGPAIVAPENLVAPRISGTEPAVPAAERSVWCLSTRGAGPWRCGQDVPLECWRADECGAWQPATVEEFLAANDPAVPTSIWIHGNRVSFPESRANGWQVYRSLARRAPCELPFRFVVWSWCADQIKGQLEDVRLKASRADAEAWPLASLVGRINPDVPVSLVGFSYGARIATGALHQLALRQEAQETGERVPLRAVLLAAALDSYWLFPGARHGLALSQADRMLITVNPLDRALKHYHLLYGRRDGRESLGYIGVPGLGRLGDERWKVNQLNVSRQIGKEHDWRGYLLSPLMGRYIPHLLFLDASSSPPSAMAASSANGAGS
jgi:hypothetical protein